MDTIKEPASAYMRQWVGQQGSQSVASCEGSGRVAAADVDVYGRVSGDTIIYRDRLTLSRYNNSRPAHLLQVDPMYHDGRVRGSFWTPLRLGFIPPITSFPQFRSPANFLSTFSPQP